MPQRSIRFPDDIDAAIVTEAQRLGRTPHWVIVNHCRTIGSKGATNLEPARSTQPAPHLRGSTGAGTPLPTIAKRKW